MRIGARAAMSGRGSAGVAVERPRLAVLAWSRSVRSCRHSAAPRMRAGTSCAGTPCVGTPRVRRARSVAWGVPFQGAQPPAPPPCRPARGRPRRPGSRGSSARRARAQAQAGRASAPAPRRARSRSRGRRARARTAVPTPKPSANTAADTRPAANPRRALGDEPEQDAEAATAERASDRRTPSRAPSAGESSE